MHHTCSLCEQEIKHYDERFNHLEIDATHSFDICLTCIESFTKWQQKNYATLFPTKAAKKFIRSREEKK